ncbi:MAG: hypothetical protein PHV06_06595 [bacterium]|nr:hypothetical protein [bacterium]
MRKYFFKTVLVVMFIFYSALFGINCFCTNYQNPKSENFSIFVKPAKKYFNSKNDEVSLIWKITLNISDNISEDDQFWVFPIYSDTGFVRFSIVNIETSEEAKLKFMPINWQGDSFEMNKSFSSIKGITTFELYDIWNYNLNEEKEFYIGKYQIKIDYPFGIISFGKFIETDKIIIEDIVYQVIDSNNFINGKVIYNPQKWNIQWIESQPEGYINCFIGNLDSGTVEDIILDEIWFNGTSKPEFIDIKNNHGGFDGKVLHLKFKMKEVIESVILYNNSRMNYNANIQAKLKNGKILNIDSNIEIIKLDK